jgi:outer membrane protein assembly factor BamB
MISKALKIAATGLALMTLAGQALASQQVTVARNGMVRVALPASAGSVIVANPNIADVNVVDSHTVYVIGRGFGSSAVTVLDRAGRPIFEGQIVVTAGQHDSVTMYKGSKPAVLVCSNVCQPIDDNGNSGGGSGLPAVAAATAPGAAMAAPAAPSAAAAAGPAATPAASMALSQ